MDAQKRMLMALAMCLILGMAAVGCNTFRGMGEDIQAVGRAIRNAGQGR